MTQKNNFKDPYTDYKELTIRGIILGFLITLVFTASNIYLGLKVGLTFASSIPAAVLSMAILRFAKNSNILENNLVQTQASAAGTLSSVVFVLPALLILGYWQNFPFWQITLLCLSGGILGVIFTVPLRRVMVVNSSLPYPEGVAAAEILKAGTRQGNVANQHGEIIQNEKDHQANSSQFKEILFGSVYAAIVSFCTNGLRLFSDSASFWFKSGNGIFQLPFGFSLALLGAGSLIGISAGVAILIGLVFTWGVLVPYFSSLQMIPVDTDIASLGKQIWVEKVRLIGVGTIGIAAVWTLIILFKPMCEGIRLSISAYTQKKLSQDTINRADRDLNPKYLLILLMTMCLILFTTFSYFVSNAGLPSSLAWTLVVVVTLFTVLIGFLVAAACGYMAGLVGSSSSPISGIGILAVLTFSLVLLMIGYQQDLLSQPENIQFLTALALFGTSAVLATATISNDNLQDLKTGYLINATPGKQQVALIIGCFAGAIVIAPLLELLYNAYGFAGAMPRPNMDVTQALAAPQASLMTTIAQGIFSHQLQWNYILVGVVFGIAIIVIDLIFKKMTDNKLTIPALAVGLGIYLPPAVNIPLFIGALVFWIIQRRVKRQSSNDPKRLQTFEQKSTLFAAGLIVGESIIGVVLAMIIVASTALGGSDAPLSLNLQNWDSNAQWIGLAVFIFSIWVMIRRITKA